MEEIIDSLGFAPDYIFCAVSTCGTIRGYSEYIKEYNLHTKVIAVDAVGSVIFGTKREKRLIPGHNTKTIILHLNHLEKRLGRLPENPVADAGYGSEEKYEYLVEKNLRSYVKYSKFYWEKKKKNRENPYLADTLPYVPETDSFVCRN